MRIIDSTVSFVCTGQESSYSVNWCRPLKDLDIKFNADGLPKFICISKDKRMELCCFFEMDKVENMAKHMIYAKGRGKSVSDKCFIYIETNDGKETLIGSVTHKIDRTFMPISKNVDIEEDM